MLATAEPDDLGRSRESESVIEEPEEVKRLEKPTVTLSSSWSDYLQALALATTRINCCYSIFNALVLS